MRAETSQVGWGGVQSILGPKANGNAGHELGRYCH